MNLDARLSAGKHCAFADLQPTMYVGTIQSRTNIAPFIDFEEVGHNPVTKKISVRPVVLTSESAEDLIKQMKASETGQGGNLTHKGSRMFTMRVADEYCVVWIDTVAKHRERVRDFAGIDTRLEEICGVSAHRVQGTIYDAPEDYFVCTVVGADWVNLLSKTDPKTGIDCPFVAETKRDIYKLMERGFKEGNLKYWRNVKVRDSYYVRKEGELVELKIERVKDFLPRIAKGESK